MDDELLQELLSKASSFYNNGEYRGAIATWKEVLKVDPKSQKAREGIQMATLLLAGCATPEDPDSVPAPAAPADGARPGGEKLSRAQVGARLDQGVKRVRSLLQERKYTEAVEGARGLVPIDPDSEEVQQLVEEAQEAFEAAPFIEEHLTLARELASQGRMDEAESECRKVFALDKTNPEAHALISDLRRRAAASKPAPQEPEPESEDPGGMTIRIDVSKVMPSPKGAPPKRPEPKPAAPLPVDSLEEEPAIDTESGPVAAAEEGDIFEIDLDAESVPAAGAAVADPAEEAPEIETSSTDGLADAAAEFDGAELLDESLPLETPPADGSEAAVAAEAAGSEEPAAGDEPEIVDATTVVEPSARIVPRGGSDAQSAQDLMDKLGDEESIPLTAPGEDARVSTGKPPAAAAGGVPVAEDTSGWEQELESLNIKSGEHDIIGRSASMTAGAPKTTDVDDELSSLLGDDLGGLPVAEPSPVPEPQPSKARAPKAAPRSAPAEVPERAQEKDDSDAPSAGERSRPGPRVYFALAAVLLLAAGGAAWWFFFQPRVAAGRSPSAVTPPSASSGEKPGVATGPIPTPIGSTSRQSGPPAEPATDDAAQGRGRTAAAPSGTDRAPADGSPNGAASIAPAPVAPAPAQTGNLVGNVAAKTPEERRREVAHHVTEGRRLMALEKWREARDEFATVLAMDPVNFESKELLDQVQARVDQDLKVRKELDEARQAFDDKDYQGALWKMYRLPRNAGLGNIDLFIRNAWFNWAVVGLKGGDATDAKQKLTEVLSADPNDAEGQKLLELAERYASRQKDRVFYSLVSDLHFRTIDQK